MTFVYIIKCRNGVYYTGITWNLEKRIKEHNLGIKTPIQKSRRPVRLVYWEKFENKRRQQREKGRLKVGVEKRKKS